MRIFASTLLVAPVALSLSVSRADGQTQLLASEPASVSQTVDGTKITVTYSRPRARGRTGIFGSQVKWGSTWTPGANVATQLHVSNDVTIHGQHVPKGKYSVWIVVARPQWEMVLDKDTMLFHTQPPKQRPGQVRFAVTREKTPFMEALTWSIPEMSSTGMTLTMQWDTVSVPIKIKVPPSYTTKVTAQVASRIVGSYHLHFEPMPEPPKDSTIADEDSEKPASDVTFTVRYEGGELRAVMDPPMFKTEPGYKEWILLPGKGDWFKIGRIQNAEMAEIFDFMQLQFDSDGSRAKGLEIRLTNDTLIGKGTRLP
jgi:Protein of unknown function (DUF2911)